MIIKSYSPACKVVKSSTILLLQIFNKIVNIVMYTMTRYAKLVKDTFFCKNNNNFTEKLISNKKTNTAFWD